MLGLPNKEEVRSLSKLGLSMVTVVFDDNVPMYLARQLVSEQGAETQVEAATEGAEVALRK